MKKYSYILFLVISIFALNSCEEDVTGTNDLNYVSFEGSTYNFGVDLNGTSERVVKIYTTQKSKSDRTFNIKVVSELSSADPASYNVPSTVIIPANSNVGELSISISDVNISENGETLVLELEGADGLFTGNNITLNIKQICPLNEVILDITFDDWPEETSWELLDSTNTVIASGDSYDGETSFTKSFCLEDGTYTFTIYDAYGDGTNNYKLIYNGAIIASGGAFGSSETTTFDVSL